MNYGWRLGCLHPPHHAAPKNSSTHMCCRLARASRTHRPLPLGWTPLLGATRCSANAPGLCGLCWRQPGGAASRWGGVWPCLLIPPRASLPPLLLREQRPPACAPRADFHFVAHTNLGPNSVSSRTFLSASRLRDDGAHGHLLPVCAAAATHQHHCAQRRPKPPPPGAAGWRQAGESPRPCGIAEALARSLVGNSQQSLLFR